MDHWMLGARLAVILYLMYTYILSGESQIEVIILLLCYLCLAIPVYLLVSSLKRKIFNSLAILFILIFFHPYPDFIVLLPISLLELSSLHSKKTYILILSLLPLFYIDSSVKASYLLISVLTFFLYTMSQSYSMKLAKREKEMDEMRGSIRQLNQNILEHQAYIKQSSYTAALEERNRLSQEIHDKLGHSITGALIQMEASKRIFHKDLLKAEELLANAILITKEGIDDIRKFLHRVKPPGEQMGLNRLKLLADRFSSDYDIKVLVHCKGNIEAISPRQWAVIFDNASEALTNSLKYSGAGSITIEITVLNQLIRAEIKDNGKGAGQIRKGIGLMGMEERMVSLQGKLIVDGSNGFSVSMLIPLNNKPAPGKQKI